MMIQLMQAWLVECRDEDRLVEFVESWRVLSCCSRCDRRPQAKASLRSHLVASLFPVLADVIKQGNTLGVGAFDQLRQDAIAMKIISHPVDQIRCLSAGTAVRVFRDQGIERPPIARQGLALRRHLEQRVRDGLVVRHRQQIGIEIKTVPGAGAGFDLSH